jgi:hypothetical protein
LPDRRADLVVFHSTIGHDFPELLDEARSVAAGASVIGCSANGVVGTEGASERMRALAVMAIRGDEFAVAHAESVRGATSFQVAADTARRLAAAKPGIRTVMIMASGIDIAGDQAIAGIESVFGRGVPIVGGTSGDNMRARACYQFVGQQVLERGLVLVGFADPSLELVSAVHHGSLPVGIPFEVTRVEANRIIELDGQPAWPRLTERLGLPLDVDVADTLPVAGLGQEIPERLRDDYDNGHFVHTVFLVDGERRSFFTPAACERGTRLWLMRRDEQRIFDGVDQMTAKLSARLRGRTPIAVFQTDCAARGRLMFNRILKDEIITRLQQPIGAGVPWLGSYGFGEFTPVAGENRFHTQTSSIYALVRAS